MEITANYLPLVRIDAPEIYADPAFQAWLNDSERLQATWHEKGDEPGEYSDLFLVYCDGDGSDSDMPEHCWQRIVSIIEELGQPYHECLVWLSNVGEIDE